MSKSPIKAKPLNNPGDSLKNHLLDVLFNGLFFHGMVITLFLVMTLIEWYYWYFQIERNPIVWSIMVTPILIYSGLKIYTTWVKAKKIKLGLEGEKAVGQFLERLREQGAIVFHDIPGENFNLAHVVLHPSGIYVIETKTMSKPDKGESSIIFDGKKLLKNGYEFGHDALIQVKAGANWLKEILNESTGHSFNIKPVIVYPGWFIQATPEAKISPTWVLNPKALPAYISNAPQVLSWEEVHMCKHHLTKHIQASLAKNS